MRHHDPMKRRLLPLLCTVILFAASCDDSSSRDRSARFSSASKPPPNPQLDPLADLVKDDAGTPSPPRYKYPLFSAYEGQDIVQLTGVSGRTLLLCFGAPWCPHSVKMNESLRRLAASEQGSVQVVTVDADAYPALARQFGIKKIPTTLIYVEGMKLQSITGAYGQNIFRGMLKRALIPSDKNPTTR